MWFEIWEAEKVSQWCNFLRKGTPLPLLLMQTMGGGGSLGPAAQSLEGTWIYNDRRAVAVAFHLWRQLASGLLHKWSKCGLPFGSRSMVRVSITRSTLTCFSGGCPGRGVRAGWRWRCCRAEAAPRKRRENPLWAWTACSAGQEWGLAGGVRPGDGGNGSSNRDAVRGWMRLAEPSVFRHEE